MRILFYIIVCMQLPSTILGQEFKSITYEIWSNDSWKNSSLQSFTYDDNGYLINNLQQSWDVDLNSWKNSGQINYTNNSNGTVQQYIVQNWDTNSSSWNNSQRATYTYAFGTSYQTIIYETWSNNDWKNSLKQIFTYDDNSFLINILQQSWNTNSGSWNDSGQINYTNNSDGTVQQYIIQNWDTNSSSWNNSQRVTYSYNNTNATFTINEMEVLIFPNPTSEFITIRLTQSGITKISLINLQGQKIFSLIENSQEFIIPVYNYLEGTYFVKIEKNNKVYVRSFIKL